MWPWDETRQFILYKCKYKAEELPSSILPSLSGRQDCQVPAGGGKAPADGLRSILPLSDSIMVGGKDWRQK